MCLSERRWQCIVGPIAGIGTVHAQGIGIMSIDIDWRICARCINAVRPGCIIDERNFDPEVSKLLHETIHVLRVRECYIICALRILILWLEQNYGASVRNLRLCYDRRDRFDVVL